MDPVFDSNCARELTVNANNELKIYESVVGKKVRSSLDNGSEREFSVYAARSYPRWNQVKVGVLTKKTPRENHTDPDGGVNCDPSTWPASDKEPNEKVKRDCYKVEFWLGYFDFPLTDNTFLSDKERYAVILDDIDKNTVDKKGRYTGKARISLIYFPASLAGLKEKSFYQQRMMSTLLEGENALDFTQ
jgi:hypothetical protein